MHSGAVSTGSYYAVNQRTKTYKEKVCAWRQCLSALCSTMVVLMGGEHRGGGGGGEGVMGGGYF